MTIPEGYEEYKSRTYCKDIGCEVQKQIEAAENEQEREKIKERCKECGAWQFHDWFMKKGFILVRKSD